MQAVNPNAVDDVLTIHIKEYLIEEYMDLYYGTSLEAKKDTRLKESGKIVHFQFEGEVFPNEPQTFFYNWLYVNALKDNNELAFEIMQYDSFSDIEFNENKSINCQAMAAAIYVGLVKSSMLEKALSSKENFLNIVYGQERKYEQNLLERGFTNITKMAFAFKGKDVKMEIY